MSEPRAFAFVPHWSLHAPALPTGAIGDRSVESETEFVDADRLAVYRAGLLC